MGLVEKIAKDPFAVVLIDQEPTAGAKSSGIAKNQVLVFTICKISKTAKPIQNTMKFFTEVDLAKV